jgi:pyrroline-5-carboxylate reductase
VLEFFFKHISLLRKNSDFNLQRKGETMKKIDDKVAIIGMGHLGTLLAKRLCKVMNPNDVIFGFISETRLSAIKEQFPNCVFAGTNSAAINQAKTVLLAVRPLQAKSILCENELAITKTRSKAFISFMAAVSLKQLRKIVRSSNVIKCSITVAAELGRGPIVYKALSEYNTNVFHQAMYILEQLGSPFRAVDEYDVDCSIVSSGALFALIVDHIRSYTEASGDMFYERYKARKLIAETFMAASLYCLNKEDLSETEIINSIATKGGMTARMLESINSAGIQTIMDTAIHSGRNRMVEIIDLLKTS